MLLWVIIKTTDNGAKCLLTGLAIILRNQDRWEHYKLQINLSNNEGPHSALPRSHLLSHEHNMYSLYQTIFAWFFPFFQMDESQRKNRSHSDFVQVRIKITPSGLWWSRSQKRAECWTFLSCSSFTAKAWSALWDRVYSACLTRTNDRRPSAYMLTAVCRPHPGNDCVINPEPFFKLLLTAEGQNRTQTVSAHLSPRLHRRMVWSQPVISHCHS